LNISSSGRSTTAVFRSTANAKGPIL
jgi:hypothetical protein